MGLGTLVLSALTALNLSQQKMTKSSILDVLALEYSTEIGRLMRLPNACSSLLRNIEIGNEARKVLHINQLNDTPLRTEISRVQTFDAALSLLNITLEKVDPSATVSPISYYFFLEIEKDRKSILGISHLRRRTNLLRLNVVGGITQHNACASVDGINVDGLGTLCPTGQFMIGTSPEGFPVCTTEGSQPGAPCRYNGWAGITSSRGGQRCCLTGFFPGSGGGDFHGGLAGGSVSGCYNF